MPLLDSISIDAALSPLVRRTMPLVLMLAGGLGCASASGADPAADVGLWRTVAAAPTSRLSTQMVDRTCREVLRVDGSGSALRIRLSNALNPAPLRLSAGTVAVRTTNAATDPTTLRPVTFGGARAVSVAAGAVATSDPVPLAVTSGADLAISLAVAGSQRLSEHQHGVPTGWCTAAGTGDSTADVTGTGFTDAG